MVRGGSHQGRAAEHQGGRPQRCSAGLCGWPPTADAWTTLQTEPPARHNPLLTMCISPTPVHAAGETSVMQLGNLEDTCVMQLQLGRYKCHAAATWKICAVSQAGKQASSKCLMLSHTQHMMMMMMHIFKMSRALKLDFIVYTASIHPRLVMTKHT